MTARLIVSDAARADVREILDYLQREAGKRIALRYSMEFDAAIDRIADLPHTGSPRTSFGPNMRVIIITPYLIFYEATPDGELATVLRVLHGSRNITETLIRGPVGR
jgi:plasmid stabilization system protein ParE